MVTQDGTRAIRLLTIVQAGDRGGPPDRMGSVILTPGYDDQGGRVVTVREMDADAAGLTPAARVSFGPDRPADAALEELIRAVLTLTTPDPAPVKRAP
jgi:hypothetical protein